MAIGTLYISHADYDFAQLSDSTWLTHDNLNECIISKDVLNYHTSIEDCGLKIEEIDTQLLRHCRDIIMIGVELGDTYNYKQRPYLNLIHILKNKYADQSRGYPDDTRKFVCDYHRAFRSSQHPHVWIAGCSFSSATGVADNQRWSYHVAHKLQKPEVNLAQGGSSIWDAADQLLRADIRKGDTVIWGLTNIGRVDIVDDQGMLRSMPVNDYVDSGNTYYSLDYMLSDTQCIQSVRHIKQVINYCDKINADLYLVNFLDGHFIPQAFENHRKFLDLHQEQASSIDYGTDGKHPGPNQHLKYAEQIITHILWQ